MKINMVTWSFLPFAVNVMLKLSIITQRSRSKNLIELGVPVK